MEEQGVSLEEEFDSFDNSDDTVHLGISAVNCGVSLVFDSKKYYDISGDKLVAVSRICRCGLYAKLERVAVLKVFLILMFFHDFYHIGISRSRIWRSNYNCFYSNLFESVPKACICCACADNGSCFGQIL